MKNLIKNSAEKKNKKKVQKNNNIKLNANKIMLLKLLIKVLRLF